MRLSSVEVILGSPASGRIDLSHGGSRIFNFHWSCGCSAAGPRNGEVTVMACSKHKRLFAHSSGAVPVVVDAGAA